MVFRRRCRKDEILARRIGRNELAVIDICGALADAEAEYFSQRHEGAKQYAAKFISDSGKQNVCIGTHQRVSRKVRSGHW